MTIKPRKVFKDPSRSYTQKRRQSYWRMFADCLKFIAGSPGSKLPKIRYFAPHLIDPLFFGLNIAPSPDASGDSILIKALEDTGARAIRIDYGTDADLSVTQRFLDALIARNYKITLHIVQDPESASAMDDPTVQASFAAFMKAALAKYAPHVEAVEIGSAPNRHSWSGYTSIDYAISARIGQQALNAWAAANPKLPRPLFLGPNISDFAPYFVVGQLAECRRQGISFDAMTGNLFVDRAGSPEAFDPHVMGALLGGIARLDMVRKQKILSNIARRFGTGNSWCTYTHYTLNLGQERPRYVTHEQYMNYMVRSHLLTAAAGHFQRHYWGTMIERHKGFIDEGIAVRPYPPFVHHRYQVLGSPDIWKRREEFIQAYRTMVDAMTGFSFVRRIASHSSVYLLEFARNDKRLIAAWTDGNSSETIDPAIFGMGTPISVMNRDGLPISQITLSESPIYIGFEAKIP